MQPGKCKLPSGTLASGRIRICLRGFLVLVTCIAMLGDATDLQAQDSTEWFEVTKAASPKLNFTLRAEDYYLRAYQPSLLSLQSGESEFAWQPPVASIRLASVFKPLKPVVSAGLMQVLENRGILRQGALAMGGLQIGYGKVFQSSSVVELGRNGTAWEEPSCIQLKTCIQF